jgi:hypothetical protein
MIKLLVFLHFTRDLTRVGALHAGAFCLPIRELKNTAGWDPCVQWVIFAQNRPLRHTGTTGELGLGLTPAAASLHPPTAAPPTQATSCFPAPALHPAGELPQGLPCLFASCRGLLEDGQLRHSAASCRPAYCLHGVLETRSRLLDMKDSSVSSWLWTSSERGPWSIWLPTGEPSLILHFFLQSQPP